MRDSDSGPKLGLRGEGYSNSDSDSTLPAKTPPECTFAVRTCELSPLSPFVTMLMTSSAALVSPLASRSSMESRADASIVIVHTRVVHDDRATRESLVMKAWLFFINEKMFLISVYKAAMFWTSCVMRSFRHGCSLSTEKLFLIS